MQSLPLDYERAFVVAPLRRLATKPKILFFGGTFDEPPTNHRPNRNNLRTNALFDLTYAICPTCQSSFLLGRKDQRYCHANCRKTAYHRRDRAKNPRNSQSSRVKYKENADLFDRALRMAETLYTMPPAERLGHMKMLIDEARSGNQAIKDVLSNKFLLDVSYDAYPWLFWRRNRSYLNITQAADAYCRRFWGAGVIDVVKGLVKEPETGEIFEPLTFVGAARTVAGRKRVAPIFRKGNTWDYLASLFATLFGHDCYPSAKTDWLPNVEAA